MTQTHHTTSVLMVHKKLKELGYTAIFIEDYGEGQRTCYRNGNSDIFLEDVYNEEK